MRFHGGSHQALVELASGIDAMYLSGRGVVPDAWVNRLEVAKADAQGGRLVEVQLGGESFEVKPASFGRYAYQLQHGHGRVGITASQHLPSFRVQPLTTHLHAEGPEAAADWFIGCIEAEFGDASWAVNRADLYADFQGWELSTADEPCFVSRARSSSMELQRGVLTSFNFGRRSTGTLCARIYDKTLKIRKDGSDWWFERWGPAVDPCRPVWRIEFEVGRAALGETGLSAVSEVLDGVPALWSYATQHWLSHREPTADSTSARWPISPEWESVQKALMGSQTLPAERIRAGKVQGSLRRLLPPLRGYVASVGALQGAADLDSTVGLLRELLAIDEESTGYPFEARLQEKRRQQEAS